MNQSCLHKNKVVHEREKRNQTQMACYIYFSGKGQTVATVEQYRLFVKQYRLFGKEYRLFGKEYRLVISNPILLALARMSSAFCFLFASRCLLCG
jgi:hypothetical protein